MVSVDVKHHVYCHHQNDSCIKVGSDESHFNVSLIVRDKVTRQCPQTTTFEEKGEPKRSLAHIDNRAEQAASKRCSRYCQIGPLDHKMADICVSSARTRTIFSTITRLIKSRRTSNES